MRGMRAITFGVSIAVLAIFTVWITWKAKELENRIRGTNPTALLNGRRAPAFSLTSLEGGRVSLDGFRGKTLVLSF